MIAALYGDQEGRAESIEMHIKQLQEERKPLGKLESFMSLSEEEKRTLEKRYGVSTEEFVARCRAWDEKEALNAMAPENRRKLKDKKLLENVNMDQIMSMALTNRKVVEFSQERDPFSDSKDKIVKITGKRKK